MHMKNIGTAALIICTLCAIAYILTPPPPEPCALCTDTGSVYTYPCLVNLGTGQVGEIRVEDMGREYLEDNSQFRETGTHTAFSFLLGCAATNTTDAGKSVTSVKLRRGNIVFSTEPFCRDCLKKLSGFNLSVGYVLADLYDLENIRLYPITHRAEYDIRGYAVGVSEDEETNRLTVTVTGYFE